MADAVVAVDVAAEVDVVAGSSAVMAAVLEQGRLPVAEVAEVME